MRRQARLVCGHVTSVRFDEQIGDLVLCRFDGWKAIMVINTHEYHVTCPACRYGKWCGQSEPIAWDFAAEHKSRHGAKHVPTVTYRRVKP